MPQNYVVVGSVNGKDKLNIEAHFITADDDPKDILEYYVNVMGERLYSAVIHPASLSPERKVYAFYLSPQAMSEGTDGLETEGMLEYSSTLFIRTRLY